MHRLREILEGRTRRDRLLAGALVVGLGLLLLGLTLLGIERMAGAVQGG
mgnify:CR=1 FL=1